VQKTVVIVTHDMREAVRSGDAHRRARGGELVAFDTPDMLSGPKIPV